MNRLKLGDSGWLAFDRGDLVRVGDRLLVRQIRATFPPGAGYPGLELDFEVMDGVPQCRAVRMKAAEGEREVRTSDLRAIPLTDWVEHFFALTATVITGEDESGVIEGVVTLDEKAVRKTEKVVQQARSAGRRKITDDFLREVADIYRAHIDERPVEAVRLAMAVQYRTAAMYVERARAEGFLPKTSPGKRNA